MKTLIRGGMVIDGSPKCVPFRGDVLIEDDRVAAVARKIDSPDARVIEAQGLYVTPGFIDVHAHSDMTAFLDPSAQGRVFDGVTSEINGACGFSYFPLLGKGMEDVRESFRAKGLSADWTNAAGYFAALKSAGSAINRGFMVGHGTLRAATIGYAPRPAGKKDIARMERLLAESLEQGAMGMSSGLCYPPGCFSETREVAALCALLKKKRQAILHAYAQRGSAADKRTARGNRHLPVERRIFADKPHKNVGPPKLAQD